MIVLLIGALQAGVLLLAANIRERFTDRWIALRPFVILAGIGTAAWAGMLTQRLIGTDADSISSAWLVTFAILMFVGLRRLRFGAKVRRSPLEVVPPAQWPKQGLEDVTVRTETVDK